MESGLSNKTLCLLNSYNVTYSDKKLQFLRVILDANFLAFSSLFVILVSLYFSGSSICLPKNELLYNLH